MTDLAMARVEREVSAAQRRAERIRVGMHSFIATRKEIAAAYADRDWFTLGYASFEAYVESEFSEARLRLSPDERREAVAELRRAGMSQRAIGTTLGVDAATVNRDLRTVADATVPDRITGTDGREQPASRPAPKPAPTPEPVTAPTVPVAGSGSTSPEPERRLSVVRDPEQVEAERMETSRVQIIDRARRRAPRLVHEIRSLVIEVMSGMNLGETGLVTPEMVAEIRATVDALEARMEATQ
jgi:hypothetical protein